MSRRLLDFDDIEVAVDWAGGVFHIRTRPGAGGIDPRGWACGRFAWGDDLVATVVTLASR